MLRVISVEEGHALEPESEQDDKCVLVMIMHVSGGVSTKSESI